MYTYDIDAQAMFEDRTEQFAKFGIPHEDIERVRAAVTDMWTEHQAAGSSNGRGSRSAMPNRVITGWRHWCTAARSSRAWPMKRGSARCIVNSSSSIWPQPISPCTSNDGPSRCRTAAAPCRCRCTSIRPTGIDRPGPCCCSAAAWTPGRWTCTRGAWPSRWAQASTCSPSITRAPARRPSRWTATPTR